MYDVGSISRRRSPSALCLSYRLQLITTKNRTQNTESNYLRNVKGKQKQGIVERRENLEKKPSRGWSFLGFVFPCSLAPGQAPDTANWRETAFQGWETKKRGPQEPRNVLKSGSALSRRKQQSKGAETGVQFKNSPTVCRHLKDPEHHSKGWEPPAVPAWQAPEQQHSLWKPSEGGHSPHGEKTLSLNPLGSLLKKWTHTTNILQSVMKGSRIYTKLIISKRSQRQSQTHCTYRKPEECD